MEIIDYKLNTGFLGSVMTNRRISENMLNKNFGNAKVGDFIVNVVETKKSKTIYKLIKASENEWYCCDVKKETFKK